MKIEPYYPDFGVSEELNKRFSLNYSGQDWAIVNADHELADDLIECYLKAIEVHDKVTIFALLIASIDELDESDIPGAIDRIKARMKSNLTFHLREIVYWARIGSGKDPEHIFMMSPFMRSFLGESTEIDAFEIRSPSINGIKVNEIGFLDFFKEKKQTASFEDLHAFMKKETDPEDADFEISPQSVLSIEQEKDFTHFEIWGEEIGFHYLKFRTGEFERELGKYEV